MLCRLSEHLTDLLIEAGSIEKQDKSVYKYGIEMVIAIALNIITVIIIGYAMGMVLECIIFLLFFMPLRSYAGGYHNASFLKCYILSCSIIIGSLLCMKYIQVSVNYIYMLLIICVPCLYIWKKAPIENKNKPLKEEEIKKNRLKTRILILLYFTISALAYVLESFHIAQSAALTLWLTMILMIINPINKPET